MIDAEDIYRKVEQAGHEWSDFKATYEFLDDMTKTVLADLCTDIMAGYKCSKSEAETRAYAHERYKAHLASLATARREWLHAEVKWKSAVMLADLRRSEEATRRSEARIV